MFPPLNFAAGVRSRGALFYRERSDGEDGIQFSDAPMRDIFDYSDDEPSLPVTRDQVSLIMASRPYAMALFIVMLLLTVWAGLCAA